MYRHYLPRVLELATLDQSWPGFEPAIIASRLCYATWEKWRVRDRDAVRSVFHAAYRAEFTAEYPDPEAWLCGLAIMGEPVAPALERWTGALDVRTVLPLADWYDRVVSNVADGDEPLGPYWEWVDPELRAQALAMLATVPARCAPLLDEVADDDRWRIDRVMALSLGPRRRH